MRKSAIKCPVHVIGSTVLTDIRFVSIHNRIVLDVETALPSFQVPLSRVLVEHVTHVVKYQSTGSSERTHAITYDIQT